MARANGEGSVYRRKDGRWEAALSYRGVDGRLRRRRTYHATREEADLSLARMKVERERGSLGAGGNPRLSEWLVGWLRDTVAPSVSPRTLDTYEAICRVHILPALGATRLKDLTPRRIAALDASLARSGYSAATRKKVLGVLKKALRQAEAWGEIPKSPAAFVPTPKEPHEHAPEDDEIKAYTEEELLRLFAVEDRFRDLFVVAGRTGLRQGELLALRWEDIDLSTDPATIAIRRSLAPKSGGGHYFTPLKHRRQRRRVVIHHEAAEALERQRESSGEGELVFPSSRGTPLNARNLVNRHYLPALEAAGLERLPFHALRHSFASIALYEWRMPVALVSELLGHASTSVTLDIYAHLAPGTHASEMRRVNEMYRRRRMNKAE